MNILRATILAMAAAPSAAFLERSLAATCSAHNELCDRNNAACCDGLVCQEFTSRDRCIPEAAAEDNLLQCYGHTAATFGDPHVLTFDDGQYDCQGHGEFVMVNSPGFVKVHARFDMISTGGVSSTTGMAIDVPGIDTVQVNFAEYSSAADDHIDMLDNCPVHLYLGGVLTGASVGETLSGDGYTVEVSSEFIDIQFFDDGIPSYALQLHPFYPNTRVGCLFHAFVCLPGTNQDMLDQVEGLLGTPNDAVGDDWMYPTTGETAPISSTASLQYDYCITNHCVRYEPASIFVYEDKDGGVTFEEASGCSDDYPGDTDITEAEDSIIEICGSGNTACIIDGIRAGEDAASSAVEAQEEFEAMSGTTCPNNIVLLDTVGDTAYDRMPLTIVSQEDDSATLTLKAPFLTGSETVYVEYEHDFQALCLESSGVDSSFSESIEVSCPGVMDVTLVRVIVSDSSLSAANGASAPECCHAENDTENKVMYTFQVACVSQCVDEDESRVRRRGLRGE